LAEEEKWVGPRTRARLREQSWVKNRESDRKEWEEKE